MKTQPQGNIASQNPPATRPIAAHHLDNPENFDRWAKAVREQMLDCLQKRSTQLPR